MIKTIDLFAGAGGLSYGFLMAGDYQLVAAAEINRNAKLTYEKNIADKLEGFVFIDNVIGYDFGKLNQEMGGDIDVVIGGPPCQGFSNANRQKNHLISMNNGLVKEYFRAIREIKPKAFVMENVSMLESSTHRFYESYKDNDEIMNLVNAGCEIPTKVDPIVLSKRSYDGIDIQHLPEMNLIDYIIPERLIHLLSVLRKNIGNPRRLPNFLAKNSQLIRRLIDAYIDENEANEDEIIQIFCEKLVVISEAINDNSPDVAEEELDYLVSFQKVLEFMGEISANELIGHYAYSDEEGLRFIGNSYSVIDYVNAILGDEYIQRGNVFNAEWFGVPQERRRYIVIGIRKDIYEKAGVSIDDILAKIMDKPVYDVPTVGDAIDDLIPYRVGYEPVYSPVPYLDQEDLSDYALKMRKKNKYVQNHITTKTTEKAMKRFVKIKPGKNFHSLGVKDKDTYSQPERTQNTIYLRLDANKPCGTVVNVRKSMWIHPLLDRAITVREAARLQSFPDRFEFCGTKDSQFQQVGNAVPPLLAKGIAKIIKKYLV